MIKIRQIIIDVSNDTYKNLKDKIISKLKVKDKDILDYKIIKKSIDARKKPHIYYIYEVDVNVLNEESILKKIKDKDITISIKEEYNFKITGKKTLDYRPIIIGAGPAGLFCAYLLAENGYNPLIIERGSKIEQRVKDVENFWQNNILNTNSNIQFGEGGAGTFSDGKLNTLIRHTSSQKKVFDTFVSCGAPSDILYLNKPHIGTDILREVIINMRNKIILNGGEFRYNTILTDIKISNNEIESIIVNDNEEIKTNILVLAIGHSARDTFKMLANHLKMEPKPFAVGIRVEHKQEDINISQYGNNKNLPPASYKLTYQTKDKRGVYTFCMCPGGYVVNASSEINHLAINGMSNYIRDSENANSAIVVTVSPKDYGDDLFAGLEFQRNLEKKAYELGNGNIPITLYKDYKNNRRTTKLESIKPLIKGSYTLTNINNIFPDYINKSLVEAIEYFGTRIKNYNNDDVVLEAVESRTSSPIRILRDEKCTSNIIGIYPCGEGAGYAGGITSASMDGIKVAECIASIYKDVK